MITLKMPAWNFLPGRIAIQLQVLNDSMGIRSKSTMHLGRKQLKAIFSVIMSERTPACSSLNLYQ